MANYVSPVMSTAHLSDRSVLSISGPDARSFLQGLITNDIGKLGADRILYAALLTPQGKILFDFFLHERDSQVLLDCASESAEALEKRLSLYRLRAKVEIAKRGDLAVMAYWGNETPPPEARPDPRIRALGWRSIVPAGPFEADASPYAAHRLDLGVPEGNDFGRDAMFALDAGLDELQGVSFDKGCYVGQELSARMKHRGTARKRLLPIAAHAPALPAAATPVSAAGREIGNLTSTYGNRGFALLRLDRLQEAEGLPLQCGGVPVIVSRPTWLAS
jgi:hypothetical protein